MNDLNCKIEVSKLDLTQLKESGLYIFESSMSDTEIGNYINDLYDVSYETEELVVFKGQPAIEALVISLLHRYQSPELNRLKDCFLTGDRVHKGTVLNEIFFRIFSQMSIKSKSVLHIKNACAFAIFDNDELELLCKVLEQFPRIFALICNIADHSETDGIKAYNIRDRIHFVKLQNNITQQMNINLHKVHISYKHHENYKVIITSICNGLKLACIDYTIDEDIPYKGDIKAYEREIGAADRIIVVIIPEYLQSIQCMFELTEIFKNGELKSRLFPIVDLGAIKRNGDGLKEVKDYWRSEIEKKQEQLSSSAGHMEYLLYELGQINSFMKILDDVWLYLTEINTGDFKELTADNARKLIAELLKSPVRNPVITDNEVIQNITEPLKGRTINQYGEKSMYIESNFGSITIN